METPLMRMTTPNLQIKPLTGALALYRATPDAAGLDLYSLQMHRLNTRGICVIDTGTGLYIPSGYFGLIAPRSALAIKGIQILAGIIDSDYDGEIKVTFTVAVKCCNLSSAYNHCANSTENVYNSSSPQFA
uniref:Deoxyuridine 5'-triphosphate nucleotidohydrolase n=1 Tax=Strigops habroptila TaxID=2489341 RepID=A0A672UBS6_STRHB